jgi:hypothetical protein
MAKIQDVQTHELRVINFSHSMSRPDAIQCTLPDETTARSVPRLILKDARVAL